MNRSFCLSNKIIFGVIIISVLIIILAACLSPSDQLIEITPELTVSPVMTDDDNPRLTEELLRERWLNGESCQPPCWEGIVPGKTTATEAMSVLEKNDIISSLSIDNEPVGIAQTGFIEWQILLEDTRPYKGEALFALDSPNQLIYLIRPGFPNTELGELIQKLGEPSHVLADYYQPPDAEYYIWEINIIWMEKGISFRTGGQEPTPLMINEELILESAIYFEPSVEKFLKVRNPRRPDGLSIWKGYGEVNQYLEHLETK